MRVLMLCDLLDGWSVHNRAIALAKFLPDIQFTIRSIGERKPMRPYVPGVYALRDAPAHDVVHFMFTGGVTLHYDWIMEHRHKTVMTLINERSYYEGVYVDVNKLHALCRDMLYVTSLSPTLAREIGCRYIPNGIDRDLFPHRAPRVVGYAGTKKPNKGGHLVVEACQRLGLEYRTATYGGQAGKHTLKHGDMHEWYKQLDVYAHMSRTEGFNNTVLEALACDVPVIMTKAGAWEEFEGFVTYVDQTVESLITALRPWAGRVLVDHRFLWGNVAKQYGDLYAEIARAGSL